MISPPVGWVIPAEIFAQAAAESDTLWQSLVQFWSSWSGPTGAALMALLLIVLCVVSWATNLIALPGNWICVGLIALYAWLGPSEGRFAIGWLPLVIALGLGGLGELLEFFASAAGAQKAGASRRSTVYAVIGSMLGAITGAFVGLPIPIVGSVLAAILFGGLGATAGAMFGEKQLGKNWKESWTIGHAAFWGRTLGTVAKIVSGMAIVVVAFAAVLV